MGRSLSRLAVMAVWLTSMMLVSQACGRAEEAQVVQAAPEFALTSLDGETVKLSDYQGRVVIVDFWATWCPPCREEIPHFVELQQRYGDRGLTVIGISVDQGGPQVVRSFAQEQGINYPLVMADARVAGDYGGIRGIPTTFVIDRQGRIVKKYVGYQDKSVFERDIEALL